MWGGSSGPVPLHRDIGNCTRRNILLTVHLRSQGTQMAKWVPSSQFCAHLIAVVVSVHIEPCQRTQRNFLQAVAWLRLVKCSRVLFAWGFGEETRRCAF